MQHHSETISTTTCGKAILVGEHGVVYGARAIAMPLSKMGFQLQLHLRTGDAPTLLFDGQPVNGVVAKAMRLACEKFKINPNHIHIDAKSQIPIGAGLGSSAALCVALVRNFSALQSLPLSQEDTAKLATEIENVFHGNSSGLDCAVVTHDKAVLYKKGERPLFLDVEMPTGFILVDSKKRSRTSDMVQMAAAPFKADPALVAQFDENTSQTHQALKDQDFTALAAGMKTAHRLLQKVGVVGELQELVEVCESNGAKAAKITGAGGGGCLLCFAPEKTTLVVETLKTKLPFADIFEVS